MGSARDNSGGPNRAGGSAPPPVPARSGLHPSSPIESRVSSALQGQPLGARSTTPALRPPLCGAVPIRLPNKAPRPSTRSVPCPSLQPPDRTDLLPPGESFIFFHNVRRAAEMPEPEIKAFLCPRCKCPNAPKKLARNCLATRT